MSVSIVEKFKGLSNDWKLGIYASAVVIPLIAWSIISGAGKAVEPSKPNVDLTQSATTNGLSPEGVAAANEALRNQITNQQRELDDIKLKQGSPNGKNPAGDLENSAMNNRIAQLEEQIKAMNTSAGNASKSPSGSLPDLNSPMTLKPERDKLPQLTQMCKSLHPNKS